jgi:hypothetical protein
MKSYLLGSVILNLIFVILEFLVALGFYLCTRKPSSISIEKQAAFNTTANPDSWIPRHAFLESIHSVRCYFHNWAAYSRLLDEFQ